jgi:hypothetical protein
MQRYLSSLVSVCILLTAISSSADVFYRVDFEDGNTNAQIGSSDHELMGGGTLIAVDNPDPDGTNSTAKVGRCRIPEGYTRAELSSQRLPTEGKTYRYRWSYYIPSDLYSNADIDWLVNSQWKTWPCQVCDAEYDPAICGGCGGIFDEARIVDGGQSWYFRWRAEPDCYEHHEDLITDRWVRFEMLVYWTKEFDGYVRLWRDGILIESLDNIRTLFTSHEAGTCDMYWSLGIYSSWSGSKEYLELYIDEIEISDDLSDLPDGGVEEDGGAPQDEPDSGIDDGGLLDEDDSLTAQCVAIFGDAQDFVFCEATSTSCSFNVSKGSSSSCTDICETYGGHCLAAYENSSTEPCTSIGDISCDLADHIDDICVCRLPGTDDGEPINPTDASVPDNNDDDKIDKEQDDSSVLGGCACNSTGHGSSNALFGLLVLILAFCRRMSDDYC